MLRLLLAVLVALALAFATSCGNVFVRGSLGTSTFQGRVSSVHVTANGSVQVTFVTFLQDGSPVELAFCGDQTRMFPVNDTVTINFNPGFPCATIISVVIIV